jgi:hypothetical protein
LDKKDTPKAQALKEEGNALFGRGEWADAYERYGAALAFCAETEVELLAVLCNNRGACNIMMV